MNESTTYRINDLVYLKRDVTFHMKGDTTYIKQAGEKCMIAEFSYPEKTYIILEDAIPGSWTVGLATVSIDDIGPCHK